MLHPANPPGQVRTEIQMTFTVLTGGPVTDTIGQDRLQPVKRITPQVQMAIYHDPRDLLSTPAALDPGLVQVQPKAAVAYDLADHLDQRPRAVKGETTVPGKGQIIRITRKVGPETPCQPRQANVQPPCGKVRQRRTGVGAPCGRCATRWAARASPDSAAASLSGVRTVTSPVNRRAIVGGLLIVFLRRFRGRWASYRLGRRPKVRFEGRRA